MSDKIEHLKTGACTPYTRQAMPYEDGGAFLYHFYTPDLNLVLNHFEFSEGEFKYDDEGGGEWFLPHHCGCSHDCCGCC